MQDRRLPRQEPEGPERGHELRDDRGDGRPLNAHSPDENEQRIQNDVEHRADQRGHHADPREALRVDIAVEPQAGHDENGAGHIDRQIAVGKRPGGVAGPERIEQGPLEQKTDRRQQKPGEKQHGERVAHDLFRGLQISPAAGDRAQRRAARPEQIGKGDDRGDHGHAEPQPRQGQGTVTRDPPDIHPVHHIIENIDELRQRHGKREGKDISHHASFGKIVFCAVRRIRRHSVRLFYLFLFSPAVPCLAAPFAPLSASVPHPAHTNTYFCGSDEYPPVITFTPHPAHTNTYFCSRSKASRTSAWGRARFMRIA